MSALAAHARPEKLIHIIQGEFLASGDPSVAYTTILGSCVAACLHDPLAGVGGMNHFLLPGDDNEDPGNLRYGVHAMELLINALLGLGAKRDRIEAKLFGGAHVVHNLADIGARNVAFAQRFLKEEDIACIGVSLGGVLARRIQFWPATGRARQIFLSPQESKPALAAATAPTPARADGGAVELF